MTLNLVLAEQNIDTRAVYYFLVVLLCLINSYLYVLANKNSALDVTFK